MNEDNAKVVIRSLIRCMAVLNDALLDLQRSMGNEEFRERKLKFAGIMAEISEALNEVYREHPHLEHKGPDEWFAAGELDKPNWIKMKR